MAMNVAMSLYPTAQPLNLQELLANTWVRIFITPHNIRERNLFSEDLGYKIWPINYRTLVLPGSTITPRTGSIYIVIDFTGQFKDVIVRTFEKNHIRCRRARKVSPALDTNGLFSRTLGKPTRYGYICQDIFFDYDYLSHVSQEAVFQANIKLRFPKFHVGAPFYI
ncbi:hypothetical protein EPUL_002887, partial [Erysiphe pulchra]